MAYLVQTSSRLDLSKSKKNWIQAAIKSPGALGKKAKKKTKKGTIPAKELNRLAKSKNPKTRRQAMLAKTLKKISAKRKKKQY